tara:strand:+ start:540 stop:713 length:174 start_codon:yes stop_codon:yes gene_type:complete
VHDFLISSLFSDGIGINSDLLVTLIVPSGALAIGFLGSNIIIFGPVLLAATGTGVIS